MNKKIFFIGCVIGLVIAVLITIFTKSNYKNFNLGNTISNKSIGEMESYILNMSSYEATIEVTTVSNKNENKYILKQKYNKDNVAKQEVVEPSNIKGIQTIYNNDKLEIKNSKLNLSAIFDNYSFITENVLWLSSFVKDYSEASEKSMKDENNEFIMSVNVKDTNKYTCSKKLYIDKNTGQPTKLLIQDENSKTSIYILYNEIKLNSLSKEEVLAFHLDDLFLSDL